MKTLKQMREHESEKVRLRLMGLCPRCGHEFHPLCNGGNCDIPHNDPQDEPYDKD